MRRSYAKRRVLWGSVRNLEGCVSYLKLQISFISFETVGKQLMLNDAKNNKIDGCTLEF